MDEALQLCPAPAVQAGDVAPVAISDLVASHDRSPQRKPDSQASDWLDIRQPHRPAALAEVICSAPITWSVEHHGVALQRIDGAFDQGDRKSTRLNSSH